MTWKTSKGVRCLTGAEAKVFANSMAVMMDMAEDSEGGFNDGMPLIQGQFDSLKKADKYEVLYEVAQELLLETGHTFSAEDRCKRQPSKKARFTMCMNGLNKNLTMYK